MTNSSQQIYSGVTVGPEGVRIVLMDFSDDPVRVRTHFASPDYHFSLRDRFRSFTDCGNEVAGYLSDTLVTGIIQSQSDLAACVKIAVLNLNSVIMIETTDKLVRRCCTKTTTVANAKLLKRLNAEFGTEVDEALFAPAFGAAWFAMLFDGAAGTVCDDQEEVIAEARVREAGEIPE